MLMRSVFAFILGLVIGGTMLYAVIIGTGDAILPFVKPTTITLVSPTTTVTTMTITRTTTATMERTSSAPYVLSLSLDKSVLRAGESITFTITAPDQRCLDHGHRVDLYVYDDTGHLEEEYVKSAPNPEPFPVTVKHAPQKTGTYTVKLYVIHIGLSRYAFMDDQRIFSVDV
jgi:hypothetical protein